jgi:predicted glycosyltransferase
MELYPAADVIIGGGGYNTVYESAACGVRLVCRPWRRLYDRQEFRARAHCVEIVVQPEQAVAAAIKAGKSSSATEPPFSNGAKSACKAIVRMFSHAATPMSRSRC